MDEREELREKIADTVAIYMHNSNTYKDAIDCADEILVLLPAPKGSGVVRVRECGNWNCLHGATDCPDCHGTWEIETELSESELCEWIRNNFAWFERADPASCYSPDGSKLRRKE